MTFELDFYKVILTVVKVTGAKVQFMYQLWLHTRHISDQGMTALQEIVPDHIIAVLTCRTIFDFPCSTGACEYEIKIIRTTMMGSIIAKNSIMANNSIMDVLSVIDNTS